MKKINQCMTELSTICFTNLMCLLYACVFLPNIRHIGSNMIFGTGIKVFFAPCYRRSNTLVLYPAKREIEVRAIIIAMVCTRVFLMKNWWDEYQEKKGIKREKKRKKNYEKIVQYVIERPLIKCTGWFIHSYFHWYGSLLNSKFKYLLFKHKMTYLYSHHFLL